MSFGAGNAARIFLTSDAGKHWTESFRNPDPLAFYNCLTFGDRCRGLAVADPVQGRFRIMATADGGHSWRAIDPAGSPPALDGETAFAASGTCLIGFGATYWLATGSAERARVFRSCDRGETWTVANTPVRSVPHGGIFALAFRNETHGIAVGGDYRDQSRPGQLLAVTMDGGLTWRAIEERAPQSYRSGATWTGAEFVVVGPGGSDYSTDGGSTWVPFGEGGLDTVSVALDGACWAAGDHGRIVKLARTSR
ncbi:oxidoreductase [Kitasatospora sp. NPDC048545]|uniref:WD40/YVTN/BNR-like repeat-containing protein n=1 Tax=Kitasatospora sp. NPDC048545 TaxID=3157208 RepID=UPI0033C3A37A